VEDALFSFEHLVQRENILSFEELENLQRLQEKLQFLLRSLGEHFSHVKVEESSESDRASRDYHLEALRNNSSLLVKPNCKQCKLAQVVCFECNLPIEDGGLGKCEVEEMAYCYSCLKYFHRCLPRSPSENQRQFAKPCIQRHICFSLFNSYFERDEKLNDIEINRDYGGMD